MALGSAAVEIVRAKLCVCSVVWPGGREWLMSWAIRGVFFLVFISAVLHQCKFVLYMCSTLVFLLKNAVLTTTLCFYFQNML